MVWIVPEWLKRDVTQGQSPPPPGRVFRVSFLCSDSSAGHRLIYVPPAVKRRRRMVTRAAAAVQQFSALLEAETRPGFFRRVLLDVPENLWREGEVTGWRGLEHVARPPELQMEIVVSRPPPQEWELKQLWAKLRM